MPLDQRPLGDSQATNTSGQIKAGGGDGRVQSASVVGNVGRATGKPREDFALRLWGHVPVRVRVMLGGLSPLVSCH